MGSLSRYGGEEIECDYSGVWDGFFGTIPSEMKRIRSTIRRRISKRAIFLQKNAGRGMAGLAVRLVFTAQCWRAEGDIWHFASRDFCSHVHEKYSGPISPVLTKVAGIRSRIFTSPGCPISFLVHILPLIISRLPVIGGDMSAACGGNFGVLLQRWLNVQSPVLQARI